MPWHLPPLNRRRFLQGSTAALGALAIRDLCAAERGTNPRRFALLSDTHIAADAARVLRDVCMADNLRNVLTQVLALDERPAGLFIDGDCAMLTGAPGDYATLVEQLAPVRQAGVPVHMALGNHDHRDNFRAALVPSDTRRLLESKQVSVVETSHVNWFVVDSLDVVNATPGQLGADQLEWLATALDARTDKPAIVLGHHNPVLVTVGKITGLLDTVELLKVLAPRRQVKAYIFGHTHHWGLADHEGIHFLNLPPTAYVFNQTDPNGWVDVTLTDGGATFELRALDPKHPAHGEKRELVWRV
ncbi:MAG: metallophosphoesterase [Planctomycetes bacterium]|nr:metallophosphoesterase [Planctomycetota bacterium]